MRRCWLNAAAMIVATSLASVQGSGTNSQADGALPAPGVAFASSPTVRVVATARPLTVRAGRKETLTATVWSSRYLGPVIIDFEVADSRGAKVYEKAQVVQLKANQALSVTKAFVPESEDFAGTYDLNVGVFGPSWRPLYLWNRGAASFLLGGRARPQLSAAGEAVPGHAYPGQTIQLTALVSVKGPAVSHILADVEIYRGSRKVYQRTRSGIRVARNGSTRVAFAWRVPRSLPSGDYVMTVGVFGPNWSPLYAWNGQATSLAIV